MIHPSTILIIDDEEGIAWSLRKGFERDGHKVLVSPSAEDGLKKAAADPPDAIFLDIRLPGMDGLSALKQLKQIAPQAAIVIMTAHGNLNTAVRAVEGGAFDYLSKPFDLDVALSTARRAVRREAQPPEPTEILLPEEGEFVGRSPAIQQIYKRIALVAPTHSCVLITGESGTGKDVVARAIHAHSQRRAKPFLPVHVAAFNPNLVESELFGHVKGAFTGADRARPGLLSLADGGTVFLDELADIPMTVQAKLLRVLERQEIQPVGGVETHRVDIRLISATNLSLEEAVKEGRFRHDLYFRLNVYPIHLPPLRDRVEDIPLLAEFFLRQFGAVSISPETLAELARRPWPGNVRELRNALEHAYIQARSQTILPEHLPTATSFSSHTLSERIGSLIRDWIHDQIVQAGVDEPTDLHERLTYLVEPILLKEVLDRLQGNRLAAGRWLGVARATVRKLIRKYQLETQPDSDDESDAV